jgi:hypothetical protein
MMTGELFVLVREWRREVVEAEKVYSGIRLLQREFPRSVVAGHNLAVVGGPWSD